MKEFIGAVVVGILVLAFFFGLAWRVESCARHDTAQKSKCSREGGEIVQQNNNWYCRYPKLIEKN